MASPRGTARCILRRRQRRWRAIVRPRLRLGLFTFYFGAAALNLNVATCWAQQIPPQAVEQDLAADKLTLVGAAFLLLVMGPPIEELVFRGYAARVARRLRAAPVALHPCPLFGLGHDGVLSASATGLIFRFLRVAGRACAPRSPRTCCATRSR